MFNYLRIVLAVPFLAIGSFLFAVGLLVMGANDKEDLRAALEAWIEENKDNI